MIIAHRNAQIEEVSCEEDQCCKYQYQDAVQIWFSGSRNQEKDGSAS